VGLGLIAYPLIAWILPKNDWQEVAPLLAILACLSVFRPITWVISAYMEAESKTGRLMFLEIAKVAFIVGGIGLVSRWGAHAAAGAVGLAFGLTALAGIAMVVRHGPSLKNLGKGFIQPLLACIVMAAAVWLTHRGLQMTGLSHPSVYVIVEIVVGAIAYVIAALVFARETSKDLLQLLFKALKR
jgi:O-antigen/teichoic acid export membrane protein